METLQARSRDKQRIGYFFNHFPARGWKRGVLGGLVDLQAFSIISPQGDGNQTYAVVRRRSLSTFSIISPQGDGNLGHLLYGDIDAFQPFSIISPQGDGNKRHPFVARVS